MSNLHVNTLWPTDNSLSVDVKDLAGRIKRSVNVLTYGADPTGTYDSTAAFNRAAAASGGDLVEVSPDGNGNATYKVLSATNSAVWSIHPGVTITGKSNAGSAGGGVPDFSNLTGRAFNMSPGGQMGLRLGSTSPWLTANFRDPIEYISETVSVAKSGGYGLVGASRASDDPAANMNSIGVGAFGYNDYATAPNPVWASYMEGRRNAGTGPLFGLEMDFVNLGTDFKETTVNTIDPYSANSPVIGLRLSAGGGVGGNPCSTGMDFSPNGTTWNNGIMFRAGSLTDGKAIGMPADYAINYYDATGAIIGVRNGYGSFLTDIGDANTTCVTDQVIRNRTTGKTADGDYLYLLQARYYPASASAISNQLVFKQVSTYRTSAILTANNDTAVAVGIAINEFSNNSVAPNIDASLSLGTAAYRWGQIYSSTSTISTSDGNLKTDIRDLTDVEKRVASKVKGLIKMFRFKEDKEQKGEDARIHTGVIAQDVIAAFEGEGLDPFRYGIVCLDKWDAISEQRDDKTGKVIREAKAAGERYGIRYEELMCFIISSI